MQSGDVKVKKLHDLLKSISDYTMEIGLGLDSIEYDDITMTEENKKEVYEGMLRMTIKLSKTVAELEKELMCEVEIP